MSAIEALARRTRTNRFRILGEAMGNPEVMPGHKPVLEQMKPC